MAFRKCPQQGVYRYEENDEGYGNLNINEPALLKGQIFHHAMEDFYNKIKLEDINDPLEYFTNLLPNVIQPDLKEWFAWYAKYEADRYNKCENLDYFLPYRQEMAISYEIDGINRTGHFDRIDRIDDTTLQIIEYKTGRYNDPSKPHRLSNIRAEVEWYRSILSNLEEFKDYKIASWKMINPTLGVTISDKFLPTTKYYVSKSASNMKKVLEGKEPPIKKIGPVCMTCKFAKQCLKYDDPYHEIFGKNFT